MSIVLFKRFEMMQLKNVTLNAKNARNNILKIPLKKVGLKKKCQYTHQKIRIDAIKNVIKAKKCNKKKKTFPIFICWRKKNTIFSLFWLSIA